MAESGVPSEVKKKAKKSIRPLIGLVVLIGCFVFAGLHFKEVAEFLSVLEHANPWWVALAVLLQVLTYFCSGGIFYEILRAAKSKVPLKRLAELSIERMSVNQLAPAAGLSGHAYVFVALRRFNVSRGTAAEAVFIDTMSFYIGYAISVVLVLGIVLGLHEASPLIIGALLLFLLIAAFIIGGIFWLFEYTNRELPRWMRRIAILDEVARSLKAARPERISAPWVLSITSFYEFLVFALDGATLWAVMQIINVPLEITVCFSVFILASIAGSLSLLPGGVGGFEAACVLALRWFGVDLGAALTATLLLRGLTLWFPLIPGSILAAKYVVIRDEEDEFA